MTLKQWFLNAVGAHKRAPNVPTPAVQQVPTEQEKHEQRKRDTQLARESWKRLGLKFRIDGYKPNEWMAPLGEDTDYPNTPPGGTLIHLNLHPLACYRALGLSNVVDHWVPWVAEEGWDILTQNQPFVLKRLGPARQWGHIEHPAFWKEVAAMLAVKDTTGAETQSLLQQAGWAGNLVPFTALPREDVEQYSKSGQTCHPRAALWLHSAGLLPHDQLLASLGNWDHLFPLGGHTFLQWGKNTPIPVAYILDWMEPLLSGFPLTIEHKVSLVGQAILAFGSDAWEKHLAPTCRPYLAEVDMALLRAVCGEQPFSTDPLHETIRAWTLDFKPALPGETMGTALDLRQQLKNPHAGLCLLMDLQEPTSRAQLYRLAAMAQNIDKGLVAAPQTIALPSME